MISRNYDKQICMNYNNVQCIAIDHIGISYDEQICINDDNVQYITIDVIDMIC